MLHIKNSSVQTYSVSNDGFMVSNSNAEIYGF